ncbi:MAG: transglutaminase domain-containing protein [Gemmiger qucibialis]
MKKDKRILALVLAAAMMGTTALPVWAQTPETADSSVVEVEGTLENIIAAREALAAQPATLAEDDNNIQAAQTMVERVANAVKNHTETAEKVNIKDLNLDKDLVLSTLADLNARVEGGEAISKLSCYYSRDTGLAVAIGLEYCTAQDVAAMQVKLDQLVDQANTLCQTDLEKVFYVHEWLVQNIAYDREHLSDDVQDDHNLRGALLEGTAVCDGYAKTYALTLRKLGITGVLVTSKDIGHAWNMVELDGNWYQVDCTWDDPVDGSDQLGYCMHKHLLCTTEEMNTNHNDDGDDSVAFDLENLGTQNIVNLATDDTYENTWWKDKKSAIFPCGGDWYYASGERLFWRDDLGDCDSNLAREDDSGVVAGSIALDGTLLVATDKQACEQSSWIKQYELDPASHEVTEKKKESLQSIGIAAQWDGIYYAVSQQEYHQDVRQYIKTRDIPVPTATPTAVPTATPTAAPTAAPTATPTATPVKPTATPTATPVKPTATPASGYTGWKTVNGKDYWYENGVKQGTTGRGKEIYDPDSDAWYWLDANRGGAKAVSKDVYQESNGGKWVRYDANGHMIKGWDTNDDGTYYFDLVTGAMTKGDATIDGLPCCFDTVTGIGLNCAWKRINGKDYWYEGGKRQGYDPNNAAYRGKEIYDPASNGWYWLDNVQQGAKAVSKDVYQESSGGKWVRYDANGQMIKGWNTNADGTYYFDPITGAMAKGTTTIDGMTYYFDPATGVKR